jgi:hypothetical protein
MYSILNFLIHTVFKSNELTWCKPCPSETKNLISCSSKSAKKYIALGAEAAIIQFHNLKKQIKKYAPYETVLSLTQDAFLPCQQPKLTHFSAAWLFNHVKLDT